MDTDSRPAGALGADEQGWCYWHQGPSGTAEEVQTIERASGPPVPLTACAPCREQRGLATVSEAILALISS